jgi:hypothetical protein
MRERHIERVSLARGAQWQKRTKPNDTTTLLDSLVGRYEYVCYPLIPATQDRPQCLIGKTYQTSPHWKELHRVG